MTIFREAFSPELIDPGHQPIESDDEPEMEDQIDVFVDKAKRHEIFQLRVLENAIAEEGGLE